MRPVGTAELVKSAILFVLVVLALFVVIYLVMEV